MSESKTGYIGEKFEFNKPVAPYDKIREGYLHRNAKKTEEMLMMKAVNESSKSTTSAKSPKSSKSRKTKTDKEVVQ